MTTATEAAGERRHVTVMFRDLVDSTGIASRLDAEEWRDLVVSTPYFERALQVAHKQHAKSWEPRAAMSMARLWRDQGKRDKARDLLAQVYCWFIEGFDTLDLKELKALLDELNA
jgi:predicted ATPase